MTKALFCLIPDVSTYEGGKIYLFNRSNWDKLPNHRLVCPNCGSIDLFPSADKNKGGFSDKFYCWHVGYNSVEGCKAEIRILDD
jgi:hypothetical protein